MVEQERTTLVGELFETHVRATSLFTFRGSGTRDGLLEGGVRRELLGVGFDLFADEFLVLSDDRAERLPVERLFGNLFDVCEILRLETRNGQQAAAQRLALVD